MDFISKSDSFNVIVEVRQLFGAQASFEEIRHAAGRICRDYLNGQWKEVPSDQLIVKRISGGLSNLLYYVSLPPDSNGSDGEVNDSVVEAELNKATTTTTTSSSSSSLTSSLPADNDENRNEPDFSDLLTAGDCNGNKRKRYDSSSSTLASALRHKEPKEVLLRIYGQSHGEDALEQMITESVVFALLSERHFGPRLYGIFPGGRIEQYIPARALQTAELAIPEISLRVAEKMAEIHSLNIPMSKEPDWIWNCMERWQRHIPEILSRTDWQEHELVSAQHMRGINFEKEALWMKQVIRKANCPVVFCHNDLQEGNILIKSSNDISDCNAEDAALENISMNSDDVVDNNTSNKPPADLDTSADSAIDNTISSTVPDLRIIDFEYCAYNYRGFDLANHFLEWTFNYSRPDFPFYYYHSENFPTKEQRHCFIRRYLKKINDCEEEWEPSQKEIDEVDVEVKIFRMMSHLFWTLWSLMNVTSNIEFAYWHYAVTRINEYLVLKQNFITDNMMTV
ncbi:choline/ethanolamine kinase isoform X3 [Stomoxys calcitrans]|uniref:choline/ethanolamine kinase isoform X3 n=1 Tax=Stomoxys calcitrans TaxID=35570 RepID=UPI0027E3AA19|nr:choline/ethanolamine kinase isoform X3 [Stomoxys calcitrans]